MYINVYTGLYEKGIGYWVALRNIGTIFLIDESGNSRYIGLLKDGNKNLSNDIGKVYASKESVYFFSRVSYELWIMNKFDYSLNHYEYYDAKDKNGLMISNVEVIEDEAWIFSNKFTVPIVKLDLNNELKVSTLEWNVDPKLGESSITRTDVHNSKISFMNRREKEIYFFDVDCQKQKLSYRILEDLSYINCFTQDSQYIYYLGKKKDCKTYIGIIGKDTWKREEIDVTNDICLADSIYMKYFKMIKYKDYLYMVSTDSNELVEFNVNDKCVKWIKGDDYCDKNSEPGKPLLNDVQITNEKMFIYSPVVGEIQQFLWDEKHMHKLNIDIEENEYTKSIKNLGENNGLFIENSQIKLENFLKAI